MGPRASFSRPGSPNYPETSEITAVGPGSLRSASFSLPVTPVSSPLLLLILEPGLCCPTCSLSAAGYPQPPTGGQDQQAASFQTHGMC